MSDLIRVDSLIGIDVVEGIREIGQALSRAIHIYIINFLFVQRPKGMLPVYEGILLIKERASETPRTS